MIAYLDEKEEKKDIVFAQVTGNRNEIREKINNSKYGNILDKYCLRKYLSEAMILNSNGFNEVMFCNPNDVLENIDLSFDKLEEIFSDIDYEEFLKNAEVYATRLFMLKQDIMPFINLKEIDRIAYDEKKVNKNEKLKNNILLNTQILKLMNTRKTKEYNYDSENVQSILDNDSMFDDYFIEDAVLDMDKDEARSKVKKLKRD